MAAANEYQILQIGLSVYLKKGPNRYEYWPFVFFVFPEGPRSIPQDIKFQSKTAHFLKEQSFDIEK